jgi:hypothetical protein
MTTMVTPIRATADRSTFIGRAARELRRFVVNPVFLFGVVMVVVSEGLGPDPGVVEIDTANPYTAIFLGGFGMMAAYWQTRSLRHSEPVVGVTPTSLPARTAALCAVAVVPLLCSLPALFAFLHWFPIEEPLYGAFSPSARIAVLIGQIVLPSLGGPLLGIALGRWVGFPGAAFVAFLLSYGWVSLITVLSMSHPDSTFVAVLRLFAPFAFFTFTGDTGGELTTWRGSPWFFLGWQLALCAIAVLVAVLRGAEGQARLRIIQALAMLLVVAAVLLGLAATGGFTHPVVAG